MSTTASNFAVYKEDTFRNLNTQRKLDVGGSIDPIVLDLTEAAAVPGGNPTPHHGKLWVDSSTNPNRLMFTNDGNANIPITAPTGNPVQGPVSSTDNALVRWDGITGNLTQNSLAILSDTGNLTARSYKTVNSLGQSVESLATMTVPQDILVAETTVIYNTETYDDSLSYNNATGIYTVPVSATYNISASILWAANAVGARTIRIRVNGTIIATEANASNVSLLQSLSWTQRLVAGDLINIGALQTSGGTLVGGAGVGSALSITAV